MDTNSANTSAPTVPVVPAAPSTPQTPVSPIQKYIATLAEKQILTDKFIVLRFQLVQPNRLEFKAGQYILLTVPGTPQKKSYSIASAPQVNYAFDLLIDISPQGPGSKYLQSMQPGDEIEFMAPVGRFVVEPRDSAIGQTEQQLVFVATGSGIAPMKGMLEDLLITQHDTRPMVLYWGLRYAQDQFWYDEFSRMSQQHQNFQFHPVLSQAPEEWPLCRGRVTDCLMVHPQPVAGSAGYYLCGNSPMIADVTKLLTEKGVPVQNIHHEKFH